MDDALNTGRGIDRSTDRIEKYERSYRKCMPKKSILLGKDII